MDERDLDGWERFYRRIFFIGASTLVVTVGLLLAFIGSVFIFF